MNDEGASLLVFSICFTRRAVPAFLRENSQNKKAGSFVSMPTSVSGSIESKHNDDWGLMEENDVLDVSRYSSSRRAHSLVATTTNLYARFFIFWFLTFRILLQCFYLKKKINNWLHHPKIIFEYIWLHRKTLHENGAYFHDRKISSVFVHINALLNRKMYFHNWSH